MHNYDQNPHSSEIHQQIYKLLFLELYLVWSDQCIETYLAYTFFQIRLVWVQAKSRRNYLVQASNVNVISILLNVTVSLMSFLLVEKFLIAEYLLFVVNT